MNSFEIFFDRLHAEWLPTYCSDEKRMYDPCGFKNDSINLSEVDARDCMLAIDHQVVYDTRGGRYRASQSSAHEVLFWEGRKDESPRPIKLWLEPVITFAALARLHLAHGWPKELLGMQPKGWAFDLAAHDSCAGQPPRILGEVKKSSAELAHLKEELVRLSHGADASSVTKNSLKKWQALLAAKPPKLWLLGPNEASFVYEPLYDGSNCVLREVPHSALAYSAA